jgi:parvulin-like peptidyl-prolyl isomerase
MKKKEKLIFSIGAVILILLAAGLVFSTGTQTPQLNAVRISLNGSPIKIDTIVDKESVYVPIDQICSYLNCGYEKNDATKTINFIRNGQAPEKPKGTENIGAIKKENIKIKESDYETTIDGLLLFIKSVIFENTFYINLKYLAQSFEMETSWGFLKRSLKVTDYPAEFAGEINGEPIKQRFFNERYMGKLAKVEENLKKQGKKLSNTQKEQMETEAFDEVVDLVLASQMAREYGIAVDDAMKEKINWYLGSTVSSFGGIDKLREKVGKYGVTYQDGINYFTYSILKNELKTKATEGVKPSEAMMREYYEDNKKIFVNPAKAIVKHIIIPTKDQNENSYSDEKVEEQRKLAQKVMDLIKAGGDFEVLRQKYSMDYFADTASKPGGFEVIKGNLDIAQVFEDAVFAMEPGQISDIVKTYRGFHIIKLISKTGEISQTFTEAKERIAQDLDYTAKTEYFNGLMAERKKKSEIKRL